MENNRDEYYIYVKGSLWKALGVLVITQECKKNFKKAFFIYLDI